MSVVEDAAPAPPLRRNRDFLLLWTGAGFAFFALRVGVITYPLLVLVHTGSAKQAGLVSFAALLPNLLVQLPAGLMADRFDRRRLMVACDAGCVVVTGSVALVLFLGRPTLAHLLVAAFAQGSLGVVYQIAERSGARHLVPEEHLSAAMTQNEARSRAAALLGQPVGGGLFALVRAVPFVFMTVSHLISLVLLLSIRKKFQAERSGEWQRIFQEIGAGISWVWRERFLRAVMALISVSNAVFQGLNLTLMVIIVRDGGSTFLAGVVVALSGVGGMVGALTGNWWIQRLSMRDLVIGGFVVWALLMPPIAFTDSPYLLGALVAASGYAGGLMNVAGALYTIRVTPDALLGRVNSVATLVGLGPVALGSLAAGFFNEWAGTTRTVLGMSVVMAILAVISVLSPGIRRMSLHANAIPVNEAKL